MKFITIFALFFTMIFSIPMQAYCWDDQWLYYTDFNWNKNEWEKRENRIDLASALLKKIDILFSHLQSPTPSEIQWFKKEISEFTRLRGWPRSNRVTLFENTPEYHKIMLHRHMTEIKLLLSSILDKNVSLQYEMSAWSSLSLKLSDEEVLRPALKRLQEVGILPNPLKEQNPDCYYNASSEQYPFPCYYLTWGRNIHKVIINNYLGPIEMVPKK